MSIGENVLSNLPGNLGLGRPSKLMSRLIKFAALAPLAVASSLATAETAPVEWPSQGGGEANQRYSSLSIINSSNVAQLKVLWIRPGVDSSLKVKLPDLVGSTYFKGTPIMVDGTLYASNAVGLVEAFDPETGATKWVQRPFEMSMREAAGESTHNVEYWRSGDDRRIFSVHNEHLYSINADNGELVKSFGSEGRVLLRRDTPDGSHFRGDNSLIVVGDVVIVGGLGGNSSGDGEHYVEGVPEDIRGFDARSGKLVWTFHVMPQPGDPARATWGGSSANVVGNMGNWAGMAADLDRNIVYIPLSSHTSPSYGGHHPGDNLYGNSLVALNAATGKLLWYFQMVHHDLWDYDNASPPLLATINVDGRTIDAVVQPNKNGFLYVFDRVSGKPVWPIVERPVPPSTVPGEVASPTQPFPTKPPPIDRQGVTMADLNDLTPKISEQAKRIAAQFQMGPLYTPPSIVSDEPGGKKGTLTAPFEWGAANWNTGAFDPETGRYYAVSMSIPGFFGVKKNSDPGGIAYYAAGPGDGGAYGPGPEGLPLFKPPWGRITSIDMNHGEIEWVVPNGDGPRDNAALKGLDLPPLGVAGRSAALVTKSLLFVPEPSDAQYQRLGVSGPARIRAFDKKTGAEIAEANIPAGATGAPMTYAVNGKQFIIVPIGGARFGNGWVALGVDK